MHQLIWNRDCVAVQQILSICSINAMGKSSESGEVDLRQTSGYPGTSLFEHFFFSSRPIQRHELELLVGPSDPAQRYYSLYANGSYAIIDRDYLDMVINGKLIGKLGLISPFEDLRWVLLTHYESFHGGSQLDFGAEFGIIVTDELKHTATVALKQLLQIAQDQGRGLSKTTDHDL